jgi:ferredoxin
VTADEAAPRAVVDRDACMGSGNCAFWAPAVFDLDDDGSEEEVRRAATNCPTSAIRIEGTVSA